MPEIAKHIEVVREGRSGYTLKVDGEDFPWFVGETIGCELQKDGMPSITVEVFADQVDVHDSPWPFANGTVPKTVHKADPTSPLARAVAARDQAESALASAHRALEATISRLAEALSEAQHRGKAEAVEPHGLPGQL